MNKNGGNRMYERYNRILSLDNAAEYPASDFCDMVFYYPSGAGKVRLWLYTDAESPKFAIDDMMFLPKRIFGQPGQRYIDYGETSELGGFGQLRIYGASGRQLRGSALILSAETGFMPKGSLSQSYRTLFGLAPEDAGRSFLSPCVCRAGEPQRFTAIYAAPPEGLPKGAAIRVSIPRAFSTPQTDFPQRPGYLAISQGRYRGLQPFLLQNGVESHEKYFALYRLAEGLAGYETLTFFYQTDRFPLYAACFDDNDSDTWYRRLPPLHMAVSVGEKKDFICLSRENAHILTVLSGAAERLHLFLPGRVVKERDGRLFLRGIFTDRYRNIPMQERLSTAVSGISLFLTCETGEKIPLDGPEGCFQDDYRFTVMLPALQPGVYRAQGYNRQGMLVAQSNPMQLAEQGEELYWGEIHAHTAMSDGIGRYAALYDHAYGAGCLDFTAASDHACYHSDNEWELMQDIANSRNREGQFVALIGYEWAGKQVHRNFYTSRSRLKLFRGMYPPTSELNTVYDYFSGDHEVVAGPHGSMSHGLLWEHHDETVERFVEIYSMWGSSEEKGGILEPVSVSDRALSVRELLATGARLGFTGGGDCHDGRAGFSASDDGGQGKVSHTAYDLLRYRCGMTAAVMPCLTRRSLVWALRNRRTYATTGARILLDFSINGHAMGADFQLQPDEPAVIRCELHFCQPPRLVELVRNGEVICGFDKIGMDCVLEWEDPERTEGYYYIRAVQTDLQTAWSSPIWITRTM